MHYPGAKVLVKDESEVSGMEERAEKKGGALKTYFPGDMAPESDADLFFMALLEV